jgi:hypothetical protein
MNKEIIIKTVFWIGVVCFLYIMLKGFEEEGNVIGAVFFISIFWIVFMIYLFGDFGEKK